MFLNMNQLRSFHVAARLGSITRAAQELMVTPPAITMQIKQLEENAGVRLVFREGNGIRLTEIGRAVFERSEAVFAGIRDMENFLEDISSAKSGELRIGCTQTPAKYIMPRLIARFKDAYPGIRILLDQGTNSEMVESVLTHKNEVALMRQRPDEKRLKIKAIGSEELVLVSAPRSNRIAGDDISVTHLAGIALILPRAGSGLRDVVLEYLQRSKVSADVGMESGSIALIKELVRQDKGVGFFERYAVREELREGSLRSVRILEGSPTIAFGIGYLQRRHLSPAAWAFLRLVGSQPDLLPG